MDQRLHALSNRLMALTAAMSAEGFPPATTHVALLDMLLTLMNDKAPQELETYLGAVMPALREGKSVADPPLKPLRMDLIDTVEMVANLRRD